MEEFKKLGLLKCLCAFLKKQEEIARHVRQWVWKGGRIEIEAEAHSVQAGEPTHPVGHTSSKRTLGGPYQGPVNGNQLGGRTDIPLPRAHEGATTARFVRRTSPYRL